MTYGFDYWKTISTHQEVLLPMIHALVSAGHKVYIISAASVKREQTTPEEINKLGLPEGVEIHMCIWSYHQEAPQLKLQKCKELGVDMFFDDREDTCQYLSENGIPCFRSPKQI